MASEPKKQRLDASASVPQSEFDCQICLDVSENVVDSNCCHNLFCHQCVKQLTICPTCRVTPFNITPNPALRRIIGNMPAACPIDGCGVIATRSTLKDHEPKCEFREYVCPLTGCNFKGTRYEYLHHLINAHPSEVVASIDKTHKNVGGGAPAALDGPTLAAASSSLSTSTASQPGEQARAAAHRTAHSPGSIAWDATRLFDELPLLPTRRRSPQIARKTLVGYMERPRPRAVRRHVAPISSVEPTTSTGGAGVNSINATTAQAANVEVATTPVLVDTPSTSGTATTTNHDRSIGERRRLDLAQRIFNEVREFELFPYRMEQTTSTAAVGVGVNGPGDTTSQAANVEVEATPAVLNSPSTSGNAATPNLVGYDPDSDDERLQLPRIAGRPRKRRLKHYK